MLLFKTGERMHFKELPPSASIITTADVWKLAEALNDCLEDTGLTHFSHLSPIHGSDYSGRAFSVDPFKGSVPFPRPYSPVEVARELIRLGKEEARYCDPPPNPGALKGWEIKIALLDTRTPIAIALATWYS